MPFTKKVSGYEIASYSGGTKFCNGDTIMARITPCLENGKTAYVDFLEEGEIAFGSTEFIVMRAKEGISDSQFIYYLSVSPYFREIAIKSMVGSSGRQRVQQSVLEEQEKIGQFLKNIDDKIALNQQINNNLEQQVSAIYQSWFEDFTLSNGICPESWRRVTLSDIADILSGKRPPIKANTQTVDICIPIVGAASIMGFTNKANYSDKILVTGRVGTHGVIQRFYSPCWASDNTLVITSDYYEFTNQVLKRIDYTSINRGSTQPLITQGDMKKIPILLPDIGTLERFEAIAGTLMTYYEKNIKENEKLAQLRDSLLPKLMSGEIDVSEI